MGTTTINDCPYQIGDTVYVVEATSYCEKVVPCSVCFGKRAVRIELGNGEMETVACDACGRGWDGPTGVEREHGPTSRVDTREVTGISKESDGEWSIHLGHNTMRVNDSSLFTDKGEAEAFRVIEHERMSNHARESNTTIRKGKKKGLAWTVGYHRAEIVRLERQMAYHRSKVGELVEKQRLKEKP